MTATEPADTAFKWAKVVDQTRCIGCHACTTACKSENQVPLSVTRTYVKSVDVGVFPQAQRKFQVTRCNQCEDAPCVAACPTAAMYARKDGIVDFDKSICIGCKACIAACPYDAIFINPEDHSAEKCNFCAHRLDIGLEPACVVVCPEEAILVGNLLDPNSKVARVAQAEGASVRRPEKETGPKLFYKGAGQATLDATAATRPEGGLFMWGEQGDVPHGVTSGHPAAFRHQNSAAALLSYDVPHRAPWDWRVSLYTWTKSVSAGVYLVAMLLVIFGAAPLAGALWLWATPIVAGVAVAATGGLLLSDLEHPERFYLIFTRPQWRSWLVRGAFIIAGFSAVLLVHFLLSLAGARGGHIALMIPGAPLALLTAIYTAFLFKQSKGRDLWQGPLLAPHLVVQALLMGGCVLAPFVPAARWILAASCLAHLAMAGLELKLPHATSHARLAVHEMTRGRYARYFWAAAALVALGLVAPWLGAVSAVAAAAGLLAYEHAYVQSAQAVPLA